MQVVHINPIKLRNLRPHLPATMWLQGLAMAGVVRGEGPPGSPAAEMQHLYTLSWSLADIEERMEQRKYPTQLTWLAPNLWWLAVIAVYMLSITLSAMRDDFIDRLIFFGTFWVIGGIMAGFIVMTIRQTNYRKRKEQEKEYLEATGLRESTVEDLGVARDTLIQRPFAVALGGALRVHAPDIEWIEGCLREVSVDHPELRAALTGAQQEIRDTIKRYSEETNPDWTRDGLSADVVSLHQRCVAAGISRLPPLPQGVSD